MRQYFPVVYCMPSPVLLPGKSHGRRSLVGYSPWGHEESKGQTGLSDFTFTFIACLLAKFSVIFGHRMFYIIIQSNMGLPWLLSGKESACNAGDSGDVDLIPGLGRSPGGENGNPLQYSCLENPEDRGAWWATVHRVTKSQT